MLRGLLSAIGRALRAALGLPFAVLGTVVQSLFGGGYDEPDLEEVIAKNDEAAIVEELADVKRWCADVLSGRPATPCSGRLSGWSRAVDREIVEKIARAALSGRLRGHLSGRQQFQGIPPVGTFAEVREWMHYRDAGRRDAALRAGPDTKPPAADTLSPRKLRPQPSQPSAPGLRDGRRATPQPA